MKPLKEYVFVKITKDNTSPSLFCSACHTGFLDWQGKKRHVCGKLYSSHKWLCLHCKYTCLKKSTIESHNTKCKYKFISRCQKEMTCDNSLKCFGCDKKFINFTLLFKHKKHCDYKKYNKKQYFYDCVCGKKFTLKSVAYNHKKYCLSGGNNKLTKDVVGYYEETICFKNLPLFSIQKMTNKIYKNSIDKVKQFTKSSSLKMMSIITIDLKTKEDKIIEVHFSSSAGGIGVTDVTMFNYLKTIKSWLQYFEDQLENFQEAGSGHTLVRINKILLKYVSYRSKFGGSISTLPKTFFQHNRVYNILNQPESNQNCFHTALCAYKYIKKLCTKNNTII